MESVDSRPEPEAELPDLPEVEVRNQRWPSPVWLIPLAAALVGLWLLFQYWFQQGETITVRFPSAEGIEPGSTQVRFKAVTVGKVKSVSLDDELNPLVTLALNRDISNELACSAQFWVVRPRVRGAEISGISTLFSGTYVGMVPARADQAKNNAQSLLCYEVLDEPPVSKPTRPGREVVLVTDTLGSLDIGTPIFYKQLQVGEVYNYHLSSASGKVEVGAFIDDPYYRFVNANTRFWNVSGLDFKMDSTGAEFRMESLSSLLVGGIAFDTPRDQNGDQPLVEPGAVFELFDDYKASREKRYEDRLYYTLYFNGSLRGLSETAPVEFQGIRVGQVEKIRMHLDPQSLDMRIPVLISIEPQRFSEDMRLEDAPGFMEEMVSRGMRAKLQTGNLLTGQMFVALGFEDKPKPEKIVREQFYDVFPTSQSQVEEISRMAVGIADDVKATLSSVRRFMESEQLDKTVANLNRLLEESETTVKATRQAVADARQVMQSLDEKTLPILNQSLTTVTGNVGKVSATLDRSLTSVTGNVEKVTGTLNRSLTSVTGNVEKVTGTLNHSLGSVTASVNQAGNNFARSSVELNKTMQRLQGSLTHLDRLMAQNSPTQHQLMEMMEEITTMSQSVRTLAETLQRQPEALLRGKGN